MWAITRTGMCWAYSTAASTTSLPSSEDSSEWQNSRVAGSSRSIAFGAKAGSSRRRASWWNGGSDEIGGDTPCGAVSNGGRWLPITTMRDEKRSVS